MYILMDHAFREPYGVFLRSDLFKQVSLSTALALLWLELGIVGWCGRLLPKPLALVGLVIAVGASSYLATAQLQYLEDILKNVVLR